MAVSEKKKQKCLDDLEDMAGSDSEALMVFGLMYCPAAFCVVLVSLP